MDNLGDPMVFDKMMEDTAVNHGKNRHVDTSLCSLEALNELIADVSASCFLPECVCSSVKKFCTDLDETWFVVLV